MLPLLFLHAVFPFLRLLHMEPPFHLDTNLEITSVGFRICSFRNSSVLLYTNLQKLNYTIQSVSTLDLFAFFYHSFHHFLAAVQTGI
jgi:hypothetical protein